MDAVSGPSVRIRARWTQKCFGKRNKGNPSVNREQQVPDQTGRWRTHVAAVKGQLEQVGGAVPHHQPETVIIQTKVLLEGNTDGSRSQKHGGERVLTSLNDD